jgi:hypothetical protein
MQRCVNRPRFCEDGPRCQDCPPAAEREKAPPPPEFGAPRASWLEAALILGWAMRDAQRRYFKTRDRADLIASKKTEAAFDEALARIFGR